MEKKSLKVGKGTIFETLSDINKVKFLPAIQRKFVWENDKITCLFDSIMREYPIGTFLYWRVKSEDVYGKYTFYDFVRNYNERDPFNESRGAFDVPEILGVLDGQQRMSALYIGVCGNIVRKRKYVRADYANAYEKTELYFNALSGRDEQEDDGNGIKYEFRFLSEEEAGADASGVDKGANKGADTKLWVKVSDIYNIGDYSKVNAWLRKMKFEDRLSGADLELVEDNLNLLANKLLADENVINYFEISSKTMDEVLDIFVRVNSGGEPLSKGDLLFSTIVSQWDGAREKIDDLLTDVNEIGQGFDLGVEQIISTCLYLMDISTALKVVNLNSGNIERIRAEWGNIEKALKVTMRLMANFGYSKDNLTSKNVILPLAYFVYKSEKTDFRDDEHEMQKFLLIAQAKGIFHASSAQVLSRLRNLMTETVERDGVATRVLRRPDFRVEYLISDDADYLVFGEDELRDVLERKKGDITFAILTILDKNFLIGDKSFHQDHCHPHALLTVSKMMALGLSREDAQKCEDLRDRLPNLQILEGLKNERKNDEDFVTWYNGYDKRDAILCLPRGVSYETKDFLAFYAEREKLLEKKLRELFGL